MRGISALRSLCSELGIDGADDSEKALCLAEAVLEDLHRPCDEKMRLTKKLAYGKRTGLWEKAGILPGGAKDEIFNAVLKTSTNLNSDPMDMLGPMPAAGDFHRSIWTCAGQPPERHPDGGT